MGDEAGQCRARALTLLARREHSALELRRKLVWRGFATRHIDQTLCELQSRGLQSDARFAETWLCMACDKGRGPLYIHHHLNSCGVSESTIAVAIAAHQPRWLDIAVAVRARKFGEVLPVEAKQCHKQMQFLLRRGFTMEQVKDALRT